jgi:hypothetical protein
MHKFRKAVSCAYGAIRSRAETVLADRDILQDRFGTVQRDVTWHLVECPDEKKLRELDLLAATCPDLAAFREALLS